MTPTKLYDGKPFRETIGLRGVSTPPCQRHMRWPLSSCSDSLQSRKGTVDSPVPWCAKLGGVDGHAGSIAPATLRRRYIAVPGHL